MVQYVGLKLTSVSMGELSRYGRENEAAAEQFREELLLILRDADPLRTALVWRNFNVRKAGKYSRGLAEVELIHDIVALHRETSIKDFKHVVGVLPPDTNPELSHAELVAYVEAEVNLPVLVHMYAAQLRNLSKTNE